MKYLVFAISLCVIGSQVEAAPKSARKSSPSATKTLPVFTFLGEDTESVSSRTELNGSKCTVTGPKTSCTDMNDPVIAGQKMRWLTLGYYNSRLYAVYGNFGKYAFGEILSAFSAKYGKPSMETRKWQSKAGATFDNLVAVWKFKGGYLELESMGLDINTGSFEFTSKTNSPPAEPPKVDF